jgi:rhodanese-related sulfurtransferase/DNA-binding IscR family transcriptional regulator
MYVEPAFQAHLEAMVAVATAGGQAVDGLQIGAGLPGAAAEAETLLANLAAGGLLRLRDMGDGNGALYHLARPAAEITLDEIAAVADGADSTTRAAPPTAAAASAHLLSVAVQQRARSALAAFTLADLVATSDGRTDAHGPFEPPPAPGSAAGRPASEPGTREPARLGITVTRLRRQVDAGDVPLVLDVRARPDSRWPAPPWAHWIPLERLADHLPERSRDAPIVTVCRLGVRSLVAASYLRARGFSRCDPLIGGLEAWNGDGG